jgi:hypothetical protein
LGHPVGVAAGEVGQHPAGFGEPHVRAAAHGEVAERLCHMGFPHPDRAVQDDGLAGL